MAGVKDRKEAIGLKKEGKIAKIYRLSQEGVSVKEIAEKTKLSERIVRAYIWRAKNPQKYEALVRRYFERRRQKKENETVKLAANHNQNPEEKREAGVAAPAVPVEVAKKEKKQKVKSENLSSA